MPDGRHKELDRIRREYGRGVLDESKIPADPLLLFHTWVEDATRSENPDPTAMTLSTVDRRGSPSSRIVLLKEIREEKLIFFTSHKSRKAKEIGRNPRVAAHFFWPDLERQVKIAGIAGPLEDAGSDLYFSSRPFESQISAWASPQSEVVPGREFLEGEYRKYLEKFKEAEKVPRPAHWGGFFISPRRMEFWQGGAHRLHDRIEYSREQKGWRFVRLAP
ncbi:MAG: pyridoxamine 5'-phosphate oxidase [Bacteroidales bacterium]|nr:pyridoxamine 5'-phosphate oxidase [Bacteroidales bacterium]